MIKDKTFIIAEAGVNHNGNLSLAKKMIDAAADFKADAIKFQTFKADKMVSKYAEKAEYQKQTTESHESHYEMIKRLELTKEQHIKLISHCKYKNIQFLSSPFDIESIELLNTIGLEIFKIPSGEITNLPYLETIGKLNKKLILSTGMADLGEIEDALDILLFSGTKKENITILHVNTEYPTPMEDVNLYAMQTIREAFKIDVGYSDHTLGTEISIAAVAMGAKIIEKHFTLNKNDVGPDHKASLEPPEFKAMIKSIRNIEKALGTGIKKPSVSEIKNIKIARKSIIASKKINKGEIFSVNNLTVKRPGNGISPMKWNEIIGKSALRDYSEDETIEL